MTVTRRWMRSALVLAVVLSGCATWDHHHTAGEPAVAEPTDRPARAAEETAPPPPVRFTGGMRLWGELPHAGAGAPDLASDNLLQISFTREGADFDADVDPTGEWLVLASTRHRATPDLYIKRVGGQTLTQLTSDAGSDVMPAFSPDGESVAFASDRAGNWNIYIKDLAGGKPIQLTNDPSHELHPSWSPDGKRIIFSCLGRSGQWEMVVVDVDRPGRRRILGFGLFPRFSPDGKKIAFQRARSRGSRTFGIWTMDLVDGEGLRPTEIIAAANAAAINPTWSPDGKRLAFATIVNPSADPGASPESADLWVINLDGTERVKLTRDPYANLQPAWGPDGTIYFVTNRSGWDNIWALRPDEVDVQGPKSRVQGSGAGVQDLKSEVGGGFFVNP